MASTQTIFSPITFTINGEHVERTPCSVAELLQDRQLTGKRLAVECNGEIVPKSRHASTMIQAGDRLEIVVAVGGG